MNTLHAIEDDQKAKKAPDVQAIERVGALILPEAISPKLEEVDGGITMRTQERIAQGFERSIPSMSSLIEQLAPGIKSGTWSTVLGDDSKGRLPTLVIGEIADLWGRKTNTTRPARKFIAGGRRLSILAKGIDHSKADASRQANLNEYVSRLKPKLGKRVLLITEYVSSGHGMKALLDALCNNDISFDLAIVDSWEAAERTKDQLHDQYPKALNGARIYIGKDEVRRDGAPAFAYSHHGLGAATGVSRTELGPVARSDIAWRENVKAARSEAHKMADSFYRQFF